MPEDDEIEQQPVEGLEVTTKVPAPPPPPSGRRTPEPKLTYTEQEVEELLQKERDKVNPKLSKLDTLEQQLAQIQAEAAEKQKAEEKAQKEAEKEAKKKAEEEMELRDLINKKDEEWTNRLAEEQRKREQMEALLEKERRFAGLQNYLASRMAEEGEQIMTELRSRVGGNTEAEIDESIEWAKQASASIMNNVMSRTQQDRAGMRTPSITAPPVGPLEQVETTRVWTPDELKDMSMEDYAAHREDLHRAMSTARQRR